MHRQVYFWKSIPFFRILVPLIAGILIQHYLHPPAFILFVISFTSLPGLAYTFYLRE